MQLNDSFWNNYFRDYDVLNELIPYQELITIIVDYAEISKGDRVLDAGSGTGNLAIALENQGAEVVGIDYASAGIRLHKNKNPNADVIEGNLTHPLPFKNDSFDVVCSNNVIYTLPVHFIEFLFSEFFRVLKPQGRIVISNISEGFSPMKIYLSHIQKSLRKYGILKTLRKLLGYIPATVRLLYYNKLIKKENQGDSYNFFKKGEQSEFLKKTGFSVKR